MTSQLFDSDLATLERQLGAYGGQLAYLDLDPIYAKFPAPNAIRTQFYTALSDGKLIYLHSQKLSDKSSMAWDVIHLMGHMFQWNLTPSLASALGLQFFGQSARDMAVGDFRGASDERLLDVARYEMEANRFAYALFLKVRGCGPRSPNARKFRAFIQDDLTFIIEYYLGRWNGDAHSSAASHPTIFKALSQIAVELEPLQLPDPADCQFQQFDILSVPVVHDSADIEENSGHAAMFG